MTVVQLIVTSICILLPKSQDISCFLQKKTYNRQMRYISIIAILLISFVSHETSAVGLRYNIPADNIDSARSYFLKNTTEAKTWVTTASIDTTISYFDVNDTFYQVFTITYYQGTTKPTFSYWDFGKGAINGTYRLPAYFQDSAVSCTLLIRIDGSLSSTHVRNGIFNYDTTIAVTAGHIYEIKFKPVYAGSDSALVTTFTRNTDTATTVEVEVNPMVDDSLERSFVYGHLFSRSGDRIYGAIVHAKGLTGSGNPVIVGNDTILTIPNPVDTTTDTLGFFAFPLFRSNSFVRDSVYYEFWAEYSGQRVWEMKKVFVPDTGQLNLGNLTAQRVQ